MLHHSRFFFLGLAVAIGLQQAGALAQQTPELFRLTGFEQTGQQADIQLCGCDTDCGDACSDACGCGNGCAGNGCCTPWTLAVRFGATYYSLPVLSQWGFSEGASVGYRINPCWGLCGSVDFNHTDFSSQVLGVVGIQKFGVPCAASLIDRTSVSLMFDQFVDFEIGPDSYLHQFRLYTGIVTGPQREIGMLFNLPTSDELPVAALTPMGGATLMPVADFYVGPYFRTTTANCVSLEGTVGYSDAVGGGIAAGLGAAVPITANTDLFVNGKVCEGDNYAMAFGVEWKCRR